MNEKKQEVFANLRAIIISCKGGLPLSNIKTDYLEAFGVSVPFKELGYKSLKELLEKNSSNFYLFGDKVGVVEKANSAHISSLVRRQKGKSKSLKSSKTNERRRRLKKQDIPNTSDSGNSPTNTNPPNKRHNKNEIPQRGLKESNDKNAPHDVKEAPKPHRRIINYEKVTLRKPHNSKLPPRLQQSPTANIPSLLVTIPKGSPVNRTKPIEKLPERKCSEAKETQGFDNLVLFKNVEDLPIGKGAQSRLLRQKYKILQDSQSPPDKNSNLSNASEFFFDFTSYSSPSSDSSSPGLTNPPPTPSTPSPTSPTGNGNLPAVLSSTQKAQARLAHIKSLQSGMMMMEINNNRTDNGDVSSIRNGNVCGSKILTSPDIDKGFKLKEAEVDPVYVRKLTELCKARGLDEPTYKIIVREPEFGPKQYICKVQIEDYLQHSSYPVETQSANLAKEIAAKKMYNYVVSEGIREGSLQVNEAVLIPRVMEIVEPTYGVWSDKLPALYKDKYREDIGGGWLSFIKKCPDFELENFDETRYIIRKKTEIVNIFTPESLNVHKHMRHKLAELKLPESEYWEVYITNINNSDEIWCRLIGDIYSDDYDSMMTKLELEPPEVKAPSLRIGGIYANKVSGIWYRVKLIELLDEKQGVVFYFDVGDRDVVNLSELYQLDDGYFSVAPQAIMLSLYELESFSDDEELTSVITSNFLGNTYIAEMIPTAQRVQNTKPVRKTVRLWDTSTERDVNVNQLLLNNIIKNITLPCLPSNGQIKEVFVSSVSDNGDIHVQTNVKSVHHLKCIILNKIKSLEGKVANRKTNETIGTEILYLTKFKESDFYGRCKVTEILNSTMVDVKFVDYGSTQRVPVSDLIHLEKSSILQAIPAQAIKVKLANVMTFNVGAAAKVRELVLDQSALMKVVASNRGSTAAVEFFKRSSAGGVLFSVNMKITNDPDLKYPEAPARRKSVVVGLEKVLPKSLTAPDLPHIGEHYEVFVTLASSPDLFIVQPLASRMKLMELMNDLQKICSNPESSSLTSEEFVLGEMYAAKHPDGNWYRGCAQAMVGSGTYSVYLCDFGDCIMVTKERLRQLPNKFKSFPYQAIRATLHGIPQEHRDWTPVDCITFHRLVVEKYFVSTVMEINRDEKNPNYVNLSLILTDTSGDQDVYIHEVLMEKRNEAFTFIKGINNC